MEKKEASVRESIESHFIEDSICRLPDAGDEVETRMCAICKKNFLSAHYVTKHILNRHRNLIQIKQNKAVLMEVVRAEYLKDPNAKIPNIVPKKANLWEMDERVSRRSASEVDILDAVKMGDDNEKSKLISYGKWN